MRTPTQLVFGSKQVSVDNIGSDGSLDLIQIFARVWSFIGPLSMSAKSCWTSSGLQLKWEITKGNVCFVTLLNILSAQCLQMFDIANICHTRCHIKEEKWNLPTICIRPLPALTVWIWIKRQTDLNRCDNSNNISPFWITFIPILQKVVKNLPVGFHHCDVDWLTERDGDEFA